MKNTSEVSSFHLKKKKKLERGKHIEPKEKEIINVREEIDEMKNFKKKK